MKNRAKPFIVSIEMEIEIIEYFKSKKDNRTSVISKHFKVPKSRIDAIINNHYKDKNPVKY